MHIHCAATVIRRSFLVAMLASMAAALSALAPVPATLTVMRATSANLGRLLTPGNYAMYNSTLQKYYYKFPTPPMWPIPPFPGASRVSSGGFANCTRVSQNSSAECVQFARRVSNATALVGTWRRGQRLVVNGRISTSIPAGTVIATMDGPSGTYPNTTSGHPHTAVVLSRVSDSVVEVADQNFVGVSIVGKHRRIRVGGTNETDAGRYWVVTY